MEHGAVNFELDKQSPEYEVNNTKLTHNFRFDGILGMGVSQDDVLKTIAKPVIDDVLKGVNGTIFAYGQTGSGKTFTITGGAERFADRGLIPRTIAYMFQTFQKSDGHYRMYISYLEIYNDKGYDLLREDTTGKLEDMPKVQLREDEDGNIHLRNLSVNLAATEEDALNLMFLGDTNRVVAETPMNDASTRSHCLFIIWIESSQPGSDVVRRSKLHLVDLAGSERVSRTGVEGTLLKEATYINVSLHYLEQVIVSLHERSKGGRGHVPYRNSTMTSVLRDSLGGNCKTTMIGCIAVEPGNITESISTCRFAQRVAMIQNNAKINEELDPNLLIARLKREVSQLKEEVRISRGGQEGEEQGLGPSDVEKCRALVLQYVSKDADPKEPFVCGSVERLRISFKILRDLCRGVGSGSSAAGGPGSGASADPGRRAALEAEAKKLRLEVAQRDQEIGVLMHMLSKQRGGESRPFIAASNPDQEAQGAPVVGNGIKHATAGASDAKGVGAGLTDALPTTTITESVESAAVASAPLRGTDRAEAPLLAAGPTRPSSGPKAPPQRRVPGERAAAAQLPAGVDPAELLLDRVKAFEVFKQMSRPSGSFEENKALLKERMGQAREVGDAANEVRANINAAKVRLERLRNDRAMTAAGYGDAPPEDGPEEVAERQEIDRLKAIFQTTTGQLRQIKGEVEQIQRLLEQHRIRTQKEFEAWFAGLRKQTSLDKMDEERKRGLYEKVTAAPGSVECKSPACGESPSMARVSGTGSVGATQATPTAQPVALPAPPSVKHALGPQSAVASHGLETQRTSQAPAMTGDAHTDGDISAFYAALGELTKQS